MSICRTENKRSANGNTSGGKCMRPGRITRNGYLNYLREYRQKHCGLTVVETVRQGAQEWNKLSPAEKQKYKMMGCNIKGTSRRSSRSRRRSSRKRKHQSKAKRCMRPGRITNNGYLNFLRDYRKTCCGMTQQETVRRGARKWVSLSEQEKDKYRRTASKVKRSRSSSRRSSRNRC